MEGFGHLPKGWLSAENRIADMLDFEGTGEFGPYLTFINGGDAAVHVSESRHWQKLAGLKDLEAAERTWTWLP